MKYYEHAFRAYDIRGIYGKDIDEEFVRKLGYAIASLGIYKKIVIGRDIRPSSETIFKELTNSFVSFGLHVIDVGVLPSPVLYYSTRKLKGDLGIMITASHLPPEWNGFKFCNSEGILMSEDNGIERIKNEFEKSSKILKSEGKIEVKNMVQDYINYLSNLFNIRSTLKIVVDYGNSVTSLVMPYIFKNLRIETIGLNQELNGLSPSRSSELTNESLNTLKYKVMEEGANLGVAYDGDGDRVAFVDNNGNIYNTGNSLIPILAKHYLKMYPGGKIVYDVTCSDSVKEYISNLGGFSIITRVGHTFITQEVIKNKALFGGQYSCHFCFPEMGYSDDAMFASLRSIQILSEWKISLQDIIKEIPKKVTTDIYEYYVGDESKFEIIKKIYDKLKNSSFKILTIDGIKIYKNDGWVLIRPSNTSPIIRINAEANNLNDAKKLLEFGKNLIKEALNYD